MLSIAVFTNKNSFLVMIFRCMVLLCAIYPDKSFHHLILHQNFWKESK